MAAILALPAGIHPMLWVALLIAAGTMVGAVQKALPILNPNNDAFILYNMTIRRPMYDIGAKR